MMKSIRITQPWATLIAMGVKTVLTYPFPSRYVGPLKFSGSSFWKCFVCL